jgi:hypothetical protein
MPSAIKRLSGPFRSKMSKTKVGRNIRRMIDWFRYLYVFLENLYSHTLSHKYVLGNVDDYL